MYTSLKQQIKYEYNFNETVSYQIKTLQHSAPSEGSGYLLLIIVARF